MAFNLIPALKYNHVKWIRILNWVISQRNLFPFLLKKKKEKELNIVKLWRQVINITKRSFKFDTRTKISFYQKLSVHSTLIRLSTFEVTIFFLNTLIFLEEKSLRFFVYSFSIQRGNDTWKYENAAQFGSNEWTWTIRRGHDRPPCLPCIEFFHDSRVYHLLIPPGCISRAGNARKCGTIEPGFYLIPESPDKSPRIQSNFSMFSLRY